MPTSVICPPRSEPRSGGFTLLEMLVVLAIMGLIAGLVGPSLLRGVESWRRAAQLDALYDQIRALPGRARAQGRAIEINDQALAGKAPPLVIGEGWRLHVPAPWRVQSSGVCAGGTVQVIGARTTRTVEVAAPFCDPQVR